MPPTITVEDVERFRARDARGQVLVRERQVFRDEAATAGEGDLVYVIAGERVILRQVPGGYTATHDCLRCGQGKPCFRALAAVDAEGTERFIAERDAVYAAGKAAMAR